ncbi:MAG: GNAT family N-acetyltransferase [Campylobacterota bacterium]|nr:GNAT family N-acetyltransferase [Campylobacterota bacterium]
MQGHLVLRKPIKSDAKYIYKLVQDTKILDINSEYLYLLQSTHFANNCIVATIDEKIVGFVSGYIKPNHPDRLFIWQVGVDSDFRGRDIAGKMLKKLLEYDNH